MANKTKDQRVTFQYILLTAFAVFFTWFIHEFAHWLTSEALGYDAIMRINSVSPANDLKQSDAHNQLISAAGPIITILQAYVAYLLLMKMGWNKYLFPLLFTAFYMRLMAGLLNFVMPNDEGRISQYLGIGLFTISIIVTGFLFYLTYRVARKHKLKRSYIVWTLIIIIVTSSVLILGDQYLRIRIL